MTARILTLDIETAPMKSYHWGLWEQNIGLDMIGDDFSILSYCAKWLDKPGTMYCDTRYMKSPRDDYDLLLQLWKLLDAADIVVGHNAKAFDIKRINARMALWGMKPYSRVRVIDTLTASKASFGFPSHKLEYLTTRLTNNAKSKHKKFPGFELWSECLNGNEAAWREMEKYNKRDVIATEELYKVLRPWMKGHPNLGVFSDEIRPLCPTCGGSNLHKHDKRVSKQQGRYQRYICQDCGSVARSKVSELPKDKRKSLLVPE